MITEIPSSEEFNSAGINQLYLAWQISIHALREYDSLEGVYLDEVERIDAASEYWSKSQPALANAFGLIQQAMEMALKGRIAEISPFLLISRDPKGWPKGSDISEVPFSEFRSLDAADLVKAYNAYSLNQLSKEFCTFWDKIRRDRNKILHSVMWPEFYPSMLVRNILIASEALFDDLRWPDRLLSILENSKYAAYGLSDGTRNELLNQIDTAIRHLSPAECKRFFGYDPKKRSYMCPNCYCLVDREWEDEYPALSQLISKKKNENTLHCLVCDRGFEVERVECNWFECLGNVIYDNLCLTCLWEQDSPQIFRSGLGRPSTQFGSNCHIFQFFREREDEIVRGEFDSDEAAIEHARRALVAPHLRGWLAVVVSRPDGNLGNFEFGSDLLGSWRREGEGLIWCQGLDATPKRVRFDLPANLDPPPS